MHTMYDILVVDMDMHDMHVWNGYILFDVWSFLMLQFQSVASIESIVFMVKRGY